MSACLGIYVDNNIIKYAKVSKDRSSLKVEAFGIKMYTDIKQAIDQIISETYSSNIPISVNISEEMYNYFSMSNLLSERDLGRAIKTEFESYCDNNGINFNALESKYMLVNDIEDREKIRVIHVSADKIKINNVLQQFEDYKVSTLSPISLSIANIAPIKEKENAIIVNIEDVTTVTIIEGNKIYEVRKLETGSGDILGKIKAKENSYSKAYEICKNSTIYTMETDWIQEKDNEYLADIVPSLYQIATEVNNIISSLLMKISKVYITGTASVINNIELYFEELIKDVRCEILKPFFIEDTLKVNMKDYIEVNSAIALAMQGLDYGVKDINFVDTNANASFDKVLSGTLNSASGVDVLENLNNITIPDELIFKGIKKFIVFLIVAFVMYAGFSGFITHQVKKKEKKLLEEYKYTVAQLESANNDNEKINEKLNEYSDLTNKLETASESINKRNLYKNNLPVLLSEIMRITPKEVQLVSIENPYDKKIVITAQSAKYEQLAYFKVKLKTEEVLSPDTVVSSSAIKEGDNVKIVIEGELP